jgi:hypothetical protein
MLYTLSNSPYVWILGAIRFLDAFKPSEPHLVPYLVDNKGFTPNQAQICLSRRGPCLL